MVDGFGFNAGVARGASRENPEGVRVTPSVALPVPNNVPFVTPVNEQGDVNPSTGAMNLAQSLGGLNLGALGRSILANNDARRKLQEERDKAKGHAEAAMLLSQTGTDYETLVRNGKIPASASPAFREGVSIAAAQMELVRLRKAIKLRAQENPNAPVFAEDPEFMNQFFGRLNGVRQEAVVKYFLDPMQELAVDDTTRFAKAKDVEAQEKFMSDTVGTFEESLGLGDPIGGALNNAINKLKLSGHKTPETVAQLINAAGSRIVSETTNPETGEVDLAKAGKMLMELGRTKVQADGDRSLWFMYQKSFDDTMGYVYGTVNKAASAAKVQKEARQDESTLEYIRWLDDNFSTVSPRQALEKAVTLGLSATDANEVYKSWDSTAGNKSRDEVQRTKAEADWDAKYRAMTPSQLKEERAYLLRAYREGVFEGREDDYNLRSAALNRLEKDEKTKSPISSADKRKATDTIYNQLPVLFGNGQSMEGALLAATSRYHVSGRETNTVRRNVAERLTDTAISWAMAQPGFSNYLAAVENVQSDAAGPAREMTALMQTFLASNRDQLGTLVRKALASDNPDAALSTLKLESAGTRVYQAPKAARPSQPRNAQPTQQRSAQPRNVPEVAKQTARAMGSFLDPNSNIFKWYKNDVKRRNPNITDNEVMNRVRNLTPMAIRSLQTLYEKENGQR